MHRLNRALTILILSVLLLLLAAPAQAQEDGDDGLTLSVRAGFDGAYRGDDWMPVTVRAANEGPDVEGHLRVVISRGPGDETVYTQPISLPNRSDKRQTLYVYLPNLVGELTVELRDAQGDLLRSAESQALDRMSDEELLYGVVSSEPAVWTFLEQAGPAGAPATVALLEMSDLPEAGAAWDALDVLVFNNVDSARLTPAQQDALRGWVGLGGTLVITGGAGWQSSSAAFEDLIPVAVGDVSGVPELPILEQRTGVPFRDPGPYVVAQGALRSGEALLRDGDNLLLARQPVGRGAVAFLALDPTQAPLLDWRGSPILWADLIAAQRDDPPWAAGPQNPYSAYSALSSLPALQLPSTLGLLLFLGLYVMAVGPVNYFVLRRLRRRELAWITIPVLVLLFSGLAYVTGFSLRGNEVIVNQASVVYGNLDGPQARASTLMGIFSPRRASYDVQLPGDALVRPFSRDFGDMAGGGNEAAISRGADVVLQDVRVDVSGVETYVAHSYQPLPAIDGSAQLRLDGSDARLELDLQNNGDVALTNAGALVGNTYVSLGDLQPGDRATQSQPLSGGQASALTSGSFPTGQPLSAHYPQILGTGDFYSDRDVQARFQLLESFGNMSGPPRPLTSSSLPQGAVTLIAWSEAPQLEVALPGFDRGVQHQATTLYFLELPIESVLASGQGVRVPPALLEVQIDIQPGAYIGGFTDFYLAPGRADFTFRPWPAFQQMAVTDFQITLDTADSTAPTPYLYLWNWQQEAWNEVPNAVWGNLGIGDFQPYIGEQNTVRLRLENTQTQAGISVGAVYPVLEGDVE